MVARMAASRQMAFLAVSLAALAVSAARRPLNLGFDPESEPQKAASAYIAPESSIIYRLRYPNGSYREFEYDAAHPNRLMSGAGWLGCRVLLLSIILIIWRENKVVNAGLALPHTA